MLLYLLITLVVLICYWFASRWSYWTKKNVPNRQPGLFYIFKRLIRRPYSRFLFHKKLYRDTAPHKCFGFYHKLVTPTLLIRDPELVKAVLIKQSENFADKSPTYYSKTDPLTHFVFNMNGDQWRRTRGNLSPAFTPVKLKPMIRLMAKSATALKDSLVRRIKENNTNVINASIIAIEYQVDIFASCMFGVDAKTIGNPNSMFLEMLQSLLGRNHLRYTFNNLLLWLPPNWRHHLRTNILDETATGFFRRQLEDVIKFRKENDIEGTDILQYFIRLMETTKSSEENSHEWTFESTLTHCIILTFNGIIELSAVMSLALYEIAKNEEIQKNVKTEIEDHLNKSNGQITYEVLSEMTYLQKVLMETLRKYPVTYALSRICTETCALAGTKLTVEKGTAIRISISGIHHDPDYYPEPERFDPERFNEDQTKSRHPCCYLPFGLGSRNCVAEKFSVFCIKTAIVTLLSTFDLSVRPEHLLASASKSDEIDPLRQSVRLEFTQR